MTLGQTTSRPDVAVSDSGDITVIWTSDVALDGLGTVETATRPADGTWSAPEFLAVGDLEWRQEFFGASLKVAGDGVTTAIWRRAETPGGWLSLQAATRPPGQLWSAPVTLGPASVLTGEPRLAVREKEAVVAWVDIPEYVGHRLYAVVRDSSGQWSPATRLISTQRQIRSPDVAMSPRGDVVIAAATQYPVEGLDSIYDFQLRAVSRTPDGGWSRPTTLYRPPRRDDVAMSYCWEAQVAMNSAGQARAVVYCRMRREVVVMPIHRTPLP
jgi:hypothetical protein